MNLLDKEDSDVHRVCLFGPPKVGKTEMAARLSEHFDLLYFDLENGYMTMRKLPKEWQKRINLITIPDTRDYPIAAETVAKVFKGGKHKICVDHGKVSCMLCLKDPVNKVVEEIDMDNIPKTTIVIIDSGTQMSNSVMAHITKNQTDISYKPTWDDYVAQGTVMSKWLSNLQVARYNLIMITHETEIELEDGAKKVVPVSGSTNFSRNTAKYFDHVVYCQVKNKEHKFGSGTTYQTNIQTGSRTDVTIEKMEAASLLQIFKPDVVPKPKAVVPTPGQVSIANLKARLQAGKEAS